jgi:ComF family protein
MLKKIFKNIYIFFLDLCFPKICIGCKEEGAFICDICKKEIKLKDFQVCFECKKNKTDASLCKKCETNKNIYFDKLLIATNYEKGALIQKIIKTFKYRFIRELNLYLGELLFTTIKNNFLNFQDYILIPIPLNKKREKWRGFNQAKLLCEVISKKLELPLNSQIIKRSKYTHPQAEMNKEQRLENLKGAFEIIDKEKIINKKVILIDDIATTCSTLNEAAKVLKENGVLEVISVVVGRGV